MPVCNRRNRQHRQLRNWLVLLSLMAMLGFSSLLSACPALMVMSEIPLKNRGKIKHNQLQLYTYEPNKADSWQLQALQLDPLDDEGNLLFPEQKDWQQKFLVPHDRLSFMVQKFADRYDDNGKMPCSSKQMAELEYAGKFAYIAVCDEEMPTLSAGDPVQLDELKRVVSTRYYRYQYSTRNHLVFDNIDLAGTNFKDFISVAKDSDLLIVGDVRNFFTLYFDSADIDAFITQKRSGPMGLMGGLKFFLKILYFHIQMSLMPEVNFFEDSLFMPMTMFLPVNAKKYLRSGSGIYYTWASGKDTEWLWDKSQLEELNPAILNPKYQGPASMPAERYCDESKCRYSLLGRAKGRLFSLHFEISRQAAELGFFPRLIRDVPRVEALIKHPVSRFTAAERVGLYFETARLPEGEHTWDFWIHFPDEISSRCKVEVKSKLWAPIARKLEKK